MFDFPSGDFVNSCWYFSFNLYFSRTFLFVVGNMFARSVEGEEQDEANRGKGTQHFKLVG
jgi:hypothetical protein